MSLGSDEAIELWKFRRLARSHIGKQDPTLLLDRIGLLADIGGQPAPFRLGRRFQALPGDIEQPAVEGATQPAGFQAAERKISAAVRTGALDEAVPALRVAENYQAFAEEAHRLDRTVSLELIDEGRRLPIMPQQCAGGCAGADTRHLLILLGAQHGQPSGLPVLPHRPGRTSTVGALGSVLFDTVVEGTGFISTVHFSCRTRSRKRCSV